MISAERRSLTRPLMRTGRRSQSPTANAKLKKRGTKMTTHINEKYTLMSNAKRVQQEQNELHTMYTDGDFLRFFNEHFDEQITGKVLTCDIELYNICDDPNTPTMLEIELNILSHSTFYIVKYRTDFSIFVDPSITRYHNENTFES